LEFPHKRGGLHLCGYTPNINLGSNKITGIISHPQANTLDRKCRSNAQMSMVLCKGVSPQTVTPSQ